MNSREFANLFDLYHLSKKFVNKVFRKNIQVISYKKHSFLWNPCDFTMGMRFFDPEFDSIEDTIFESQTDGFAIIYPNSYIYFYKDGKLIFDKFIGDYYKRGRVSTIFEVPDDLMPYVVRSDKIKIVSKNVDVYCKNTFFNDTRILEFLQRRAHSTLINSSFDKRKKLAKKLKVEKTADIDFTQLKNERLLYIIIKYLS